MIKTDQSTGNMVLDTVLSNYLQVHLNDLETVRQSLGFFQSCVYMYIGYVSIWVSSQRTPQIYYNNIVF